MTRYQIVFAEGQMQGQPVMVLSLTSEEGAKKIAQAITSEIGITMEIMQIKSVHKTINLGIVQ